MIGFIIWLSSTAVILCFLIRRFIESIPIKNFHDKAVLITGCDSGFGRELTVKCLGNGMQVFACCLTDGGMEGLQREADTIKGSSAGRLHIFKLDVRSEVSVSEALRFVESKLGKDKGLHGIVNNAGIVGNVAWDDWLTTQDYEDVWQINTMGVIRVTHAFKHLVKRTRGRIITTASVCGRVALPAIGPYNVSKFAVEAYCDTIRTELAQFHVKVSILEPGFFKTPMTSAQKNAEMLEKVWNRVPNATKEEYGTELFEFSKKKVLTHLSGTISSRTDWVVDAYFHALTSILPRKRYQIGYDANFVFIPFSMLPTQLQDWLFWLIALIERPPKPHSLRK